MPPSPSGAASGVCRTAQRTSRKSATIGIFSRNISQMKVQVVTSLDHTPLNCVIARNSTSRTSISSRVSRCTRSVPNSSTLNDASTVA